MVDTEGAHNSWHQAGDPGGVEVQGERCSVDTKGVHGSWHQAGGPEGAEEQVEVGVVSKEK